MIVIDIYDYLLMKELTMTIKTVVLGAALSLMAVCAQAHTMGLMAGTSVKGDMNGDGNVSVSDVNILVNMVLGTIPVGDMQEQADINGDGDISVSDVMMLVNIILYGSTEDPISGTQLADDDDTPGGGWGPAQVGQTGIWEEER